MVSTETLPNDIQDNRELNPKIAALLDGPPSNNYNFRQVQLMADKFLLDNPNAKLSHDIFEKIMADWANTEYSEAFHDLANHEQFKSHPRFMGNISKIELSDVNYWIEYKELPE